MIYLFTWHRFHVALVKNLPPRPKKMLKSYSVFNFFENRTVHNRNKFQYHFLQKIRTWKSWNLHSRKTCSLTAWNYPRLNCRIWEISRRNILDQIDEKLQWKETSQGVGSSFSFVQPANRFFRLCFVFSTTNSPS